MKIKCWLIPLLVVIGLSGCNINHQDSSNMTMPNPNKFGLGVSSKKTMEEVNNCIRHELGLSKIKIVSRMENFYNTHTVFEYHLLGYSEILRIVNRNGRTKLFFSYSPQKQNHQLIFNMVIKCNYGA